MVVMGRIEEEVHCGGSVVSGVVFSSRCRSSTFGIQPPEQPSRPSFLQFQEVLVTVIPVSLSPVCYVLCSICIRVPPGRPLLFVTSRVLDHHLEPQFPSPQCAFFLLYFPWEGFSGCVGTVFLKLISPDNFRWTSLLHTKMGVVNYV